METLIHVIYASAAVRDFGDAELAELLRVARINNERAGVTGMLLYTERSFFQVLEGPEADVDRIFTLIGADPRHVRVVTIIREGIAKRAFGEWSMGYVAATSREIAAAAGVNDFFRQFSCVDDLDSGRAKKLLSAFREGRWRVRFSGNALAGQRVT